MADIWAFLQERFPDLWTALREHLVISFASIALGSVVAIPLGIALVYSKQNWLRTTVFFVANILQTIPSLALLAVLIPLLGIGIKPAVLALLLYSIMPILRNTYDGFKAVDPHVLESARGMGYSTMQRIWSIQLPLSLPYMMSGIRITTVYIISWATLATLIGAGGLGQLIVSGMGVNKPELVFSGAIGAVALAFFADLLLGLLERWLSGRFGRTGGAAA
ncbi:ABC transporter permease [Paenibacillus thailandensis]|uniref:ABC transporter permease n=1 Tax=Paenibacillus thailandensis TaxID=393250 RepID=A0ABW5QWG7_9BACL